MEDVMIPGLPDDMAEECLRRIPHDAFAAARSVSHKWKQQLDSPHFHSRRQTTGHARTLVAVAQAHPPSDDWDAAGPAIRLALFDTAHHEWASLPPVPGLPFGLPLFCHVAAVGRHLVVVGGWDPDTWSCTDAVHVYDFAAAAWRHGKAMPGPRRAFFACAASQEMQAVVIAGGHDEERLPLRSAMRYDVAGDEWVPLADMAVGWGQCKGVFFGGTFHVVGACEKGGLLMSAEALDVGSGRWGHVEVGGVFEGATSARAWGVGREGRVYVCRAGGHVAVGDWGGEWRTVGTVPEDARVGPQVVTWGGKVMVMGSEHHGGPQSAYVADEVAEGMMTWSRVVVPEEYRGVVHATCCFEI